MKLRALFIAGLLFALFPRAARTAPPQPKETAMDKTAEIRVRSGIPACQVDVDNSAVGKTNAQGILVIREAEPGEHYAHVRCPSREEIARFISLRPAEKLTLNVTTQLPPEPPTALEAAENKIRLRNMVLKAVRLRGTGQFDEAVTLLREATQLDPENSDLHRELGITFLLNKEWQRARVEMLEAIRHDPADADAHNGLGYALEKLGQLHRALDEYRTATHLDPDDASYREHYFQAMARLAAQQAAPKK